MVLPSELQTAGSVFLGLWYATGESDRGSQGKKKKKKKMCTYTDSSETKDFVHLLF